MNKRSYKIFYVLIFLVGLLLIYFGFRLYFLENINFKLIDSDIEIEYGNKYEEKGYSASINSIDLKDKVKVINNVDINKIGSYTIEYILKSKLFFYEEKLVRKVNIIDKELPILKVDSSDEVTIIKGNKFNIPSYSAIDNYDGDLTSNVKITNNVNINKEGIYTVLYEVTDSSNNSTSKSIKVTVKSYKNSPTVIINERDSEVKSSYIEISISKQKLYYYENNKLIISTDVTTGKPSTPTPTGTFKVTGKARNTTLKGRDYISFVQYWIAFIGSSYGIHDASWRSTFGSNLYLTEGSHGCINTPTPAVKKLYEYVKVGTPVYIK